MKIKVAQCFDDGVATDIRLIEILKKYNAKATFNLCPGLLPATERIEPYRVAPDDQSWSFKGFRGGFIALSELVDIYKDFEVASHCWKHENAGIVDDKDFIDSAVRAKDFLEELFNRPCRGFAYPCSRHTPSTEKLLADAGFAYARTVQNSDDIRKCSNLMVFDPNAHFMAEDFWEKFERAKPSGMFYFWGHSYEMMDDDRLWNDFEQKIAALSSDNNVDWVNVVDLADEINKK